MKDEPVDFEKVRQGKRICPRCGSPDIRIESHMGIDCIVCNDCGYDEREQYDIFPEDRTTQREKRRFSPYRSGGGKRTK